ncbi:MAG: family 16 glycoside hydrolase, partial [Planctomycetota bacterium]
MNRQVTCNMIATFFAFYIFNNLVGELAYSDDLGKLMLLTGRSSVYHSWEGNGQAIRQHLHDPRTFQVEKVLAPPTSEELLKFNPDWNSYQSFVRHGTMGWTELIDKELSQWEIFVGVPHDSVQGLPEGTFQNSDVTKGQPMGLANPKNLYSVIEEDDELVLKITGEIYAGLTSKKSFENYHLQTKMRWGEKKWKPRLNQKRDSGILYHCQGKHGAFWNVWKSCLEFQVQESDLGDMITLAGPKV